MSLAPKRRRRFIGLGVVLTLVGAAAWAWSHDPDAIRHASASSFRDLVGVPEPPAGLRYEDEGPSDSVIGDSIDHGVWIPMAASEALAPMPAPRRPAGLEGVSFVILLGADNRTDKVVGRTDAMIVAGFRHSDGKVAAFSLPRDLWVELPDVGTLHEQGHTHARISSVVRVGEVRLGAGQGIPLLRRVLLEQLGIRIARFASVDFAGFEALVDQVGGIDVDVECPIMDCFWLDGPDQPCVAMSIEAGRTHMDGATALQFVRSRHGTGDSDRTKRQQAVLLGFGREVQARGLRGLAGLWRSAEPFVTTDLEADDAAYYASFALENQLSDVRGFSIKHPMISKFIADEDPTKIKHVLVLDHDAFDAALDHMFDAKLPSLRERGRCPEPDAALK